MRLRLRRIKWPLLLSFMAVLLLTAGLVSRAAAQSPSLFAAPIDYSLLNPALVQSPPALLRLPQQLAFQYSLPFDIYYGTGNISYTRRGEVQGYTVGVQADPYNCANALACTDLYADAVAIDGLSPSIQEQYAMFFTPGGLNGYRTAGHNAYFHTLTNGQSVTILPWTEAGGGMGYEKGIWDECDERGICYRYVVGLKGGSPEALIATLESIPVNKTGKTAGWDQLVEPTDPSASF